MTRSSLGFGLGSEYDEFLSAPIDEDSTGMQLSVVSALARQNLDPWEEASKLARLSKESAVQRLAVLIAGLPNGLATRKAPRTIAARLVALLPHLSNAQVSEASPGSGAATSSWGTISLIMIVFALGAQGIVASLVPSGSTPAPASGLQVASPALGPITSMRVGAVDDIKTDYKASPNFEVRKPHRQRRD